MTPNTLIAGAAGPKPEKPRRGIQSVEIGTQLLVALGAHVRPMGLQELGKAAGIAAGKAHPYLVSFVKVGFVVQDSTGRYELGPLALQLGLSKLQRLDPIKEATPLIESRPSTVILAGGTTFVDTAQYQFQAGVFVQAHGEKAAHARVILRHQDPVGGIGAGQRRCAPGNVGIIAVLFIQPGVRMIMAEVARKRCL